MIRLVRSLALTSLLLSLPISASALGISVSNVSYSNGGPTLQAGDTVTIDLAVENATGESINGLGLVATGYDDDRNGAADSGLALQGGTVAGGLFNTIRVAGLGNVDGLANVRTAPVEQWVFDNFNAQELRASFFAGAGLNAVSGSGADDLGVDGGFTGDGDAHFRLTFVAGALAPGVTSQLFTLNFGTNAEYGETAVGAGGVDIAFNNASVAVTVVPEPGTALLMGLGLAGLAARRR
ncbi:MAG: PEP-CTERM sorting domain-containing protein [Myxococcota bacterium]